MSDISRRKFLAGASAAAAAVAAGSLTAAAGFYPTPPHLLAALDLASGPDMTAVAEVAPGGKVIRARFFIGDELHDWKPVEEIKDFRIAPSVDVS